MKAVLLVVIVSICVIEWPRGYWNSVSTQARHLGADLKQYLAIPILAVFALFFLVDAALLQTIQSVSHPLGTGLIDFGGSVGRNGNFWAMLIIAYLITKIFGSRSSTQIVLGTILSSGLTGLVCNIIKVLFLRSRPAAGEGALSFFNYLGYAQNGGLFQSLPSGDVALVAGAAAFLFHFAKGTPIKLIIVSIPLLTCASRIYLNRHWPSDTVLAVGVALVVGNYLYRAYHMRMTNYSQLPLFLRVHRPLLGFVGSRKHGK